uniref:Uncharacterized protein n=1 Tax=Arundo donax TaxID=35708 RepID=A0A0A9FSZ8_ARUDO
MHQPISKSQNLQSIGPLILRSDLSVSRLKNSITNFTFSTIDKEFLWWQLPC